MIRTSLFACCLPTLCAAQLSPAITSWIINPGPETGYAGIPSNVLEVAYSTTDVYVGCNGIPGYDIGPWPSNPNDAGEQDWEFKITLVPQANTGTLVNTPLGHIGVWTNGVTLFNPRDAMSYHMQNVWHQNAYFFEGPGFDDCLGHPNQQQEYHTHVDPTCLYDDHDSTAHAPIIGFAFDGFPIYGAFGYANADGTGGITRMRSSYLLRTMTDRTTLPDGTVLAAGQYGPAIDATYPLGAYVEDHLFVDAAGHLDAHNGRFCVTPEYPDGTYAYFVTLDAALAPAYPYVLGPTYYGTVQAGNTGPGGGHNDIEGPVTLYDPFTVGMPEVADVPRITVHPNPASDQLFVEGLTAGSDLTLVDALGRPVRTLHVGAATAVQMQVMDLLSGPYLITWTTPQRIRTERLLVHH